MERKSERMNGAIGAYFAACDATRERLQLKNGGYEERQIPYTLFGLARAVKLTPEEILAAFRTGRRSKTDAILRDAVLKIASYTLEHALLGDLSYQVALDTIRTMGLAEGAKSGDGELRIVFDESLERYAK
ncbi:MAG: hypothetical protein IJJ86_02825 [Clostridia bacterium]|nr:hypothetical protein [Clostridia bacterium]